MYYQESHKEKREEGTGKKRGTKENLCAKARIGRKLFSEQKV